MKLLVTGGRDFEDRTLLYTTLDALHAKAQFTMLIHGGASGCDTLAGKWAQSRGPQEVICPANWTLNGKAAGPIRNSAMRDLGPDLVVAFQGHKGTANMVALAKEAGITVIEVTP